MTRDPIGYVGSEWNLYEYVGSRPWIRADPLGLTCTCTVTRKYKQFARLRRRAILAFIAEPFTESRDVAGTVTCVLCSEETIYDVWYHCCFQNGSTWDIRGLAKEWCVAKVPVSGRNIISARAIPIPGGELAEILGFYFDNLFSNFAGLPGTPARFVSDVDQREADAICRRKKLARIGKCDFVPKTVDCEDSGVEELFERLFKEGKRALKNRR